MNMNIHNITIIAKSHFLTCLHRYADVQTEIARLVMRTSLDNINRQLYCTVSLSMTFLIITSLFQSICLH